MLKIRVTRKLKDIPMPDLEKVCDYYGGHSHEPKCDKCPLCYEEHGCYKNIKKYGTGKESYTKRVYEKIKDKEFEI